jgi:hypothetical protein
MVFGQGGGSSLGATLKGISGDKMANADTRATGLAVAPAGTVTECPSFSMCLKPVARTAKRQFSEPKFRKTFALRWGWLAACLVMGALLSFGRSESRSPDPASTSADIQATAPPARIRYITKNIEDLKVGDKVLAWDESTGRQELRLIDRTYRRTSDHLRILKIRDSLGGEQTIQTTNEHPFWVARRGWVNAGDLADGDKLLHADNSVAKLIGTELELHPEGIRVFNLRVENSHTYFVEQLGSSKLPILVHNADYSGLSNNALNKTINAAQHDLLRQLFKNQNVIGLTRETMEAAAELSRRALTNSATSAAQRVLHTKRLAQLNQAMSNL